MVGARVGEIGSRGVMGLDFQFCSMKNFQRLQCSV